VLALPDIKRALILLILNLLGDLLNMLDLNNFDHVENMVYFNLDEFFDQERYTENKEVLFNQLRDFNNLGQDMFKELDLEDNIKYQIYSDIIDFVKENYLNLADKDYALNNTQLEQTGLITYQFLCVDCFNIVLPKILEQLDIQNILQFDKLLNRNRKDMNFIKKIFITNLSDILINLRKLENIDKTIIDRDDYKNLVTRFGNYLELIDFSSGETFTSNFIRPILNKYFDQLLWRTL